MIFKHINVCIIFLFFIACTGKEIFGMEAVEYQLDQQLVQSILSLPKQRRKKTKFRRKKNYLSKKNCLVAQLSQTNPVFLHKLADLPHLDLFFDVLAVIKKYNLIPREQLITLVDDGMTLLHKAARAGHIDAISLLIELGISPQVAMTDRVGATPLHIAVRFGRLEAVQMLLDHGAHVNGPPGIEGHTPLYDLNRLMTLPTDATTRAAHVAIYHKLVAHGALERIK